MGVIDNTIQTFQSTVSLGIIQKMVDSLNALLTTVLPNGEKALVLAFSLLLSLVMKSRMRDAGWIFIILMTLVFYSFFRYWGVGNVQ